jgi:hypothetical protein
MTPSLPPSTSFPIYYSPITLPFDAIWSEILKASLRKAKQEVPGRTNRPDSIDKAISKSSYVAYRRPAISSSLRGA